MQQSAARQSELESSQLVVRFVGSKLSSDPDLPDVDTNQAVPEPEPDQDAEAAEQLIAEQVSIVGTLPCESESWFSTFADKRVQLSRAGMLRIEDKQPADLTKPGTKIGELKKPRAGRPFCIRIDCVDPARKFVLDAGSTEQQQRWLQQQRCLVWH